MRESGRKPIPRGWPIRGGMLGLHGAGCPGRAANRFGAGASLLRHKAISGALVRDTHKFESRYCDSLIAPISQRPDLAIARSHLTRAERLRSPVIFFRGLEDRVAPPDQTERLVQRGGACDDRAYRSNTTRLRG